MGLLDSIFSGPNGVANSLLKMMGGNAVFCKRINGTNHFREFPVKAAFETPKEHTEIGIGGGLMLVDMIATIPAAALAEPPIVKSDCIKKDDVKFDIIEMDTTYSGDLPALYTLKLKR